MLPQELMDQIKSCRVNSQAAGDDAGSFKLINLKDCSEIQNTRVEERWRVNRGKLRLTLLEGLNDNIQWNRHVVNVEHHENFAKVRCSDGEIHIADVVIGADGSGSAIRRFLCPEKHAVSPLPYRMLGVGTTLTREQVAPLRSIDQLLFQGCEPDTGNFLYCSLLEPSTRETSSCTVQFNISWPKSPSQEEVFSDNTSRVVALKLRARGFAPCLRDAIEAITEETPVSEIILADWKTPHWNRCGRVTLIGDAAHPMVMCKNTSASNLIRD
jgi:2-polyprenyl-6-methoxyphenol hydroxylase-like FAD-dependent oxidoreductase